MPGWIGKVDSLDPLPAFELGMALNVRPKALLLAVAAGLILHTASLKPEAIAVGVAFFTILATSTVVVPVLLTFLFPGGCSHDYIRLTLSSPTGDPW